MHRSCESDLQFPLSPLKASSSEGESHLNTDSGVPRRVITNIDSDIRNTNIFENRRCEITNLSVNFPVDSKRKLAVFSQRNGLRNF